MTRIARRTLFQVRLLAWKAEENTRRVLTRSRNQSIALVALLPILGTLIGVWLHYWLQRSLGDGQPIEARLIGDLLLSVGTALAGVSVIAFSLALFLLQSVSDLYSPQYFVSYSFDRNQKAILAILVAVVLGQLGYGLYLRALDEADIPLPELVIPVSLASMALVFSLLWCQFLQVASRITPSAVIGFLRQEANKQFSAFHRRAARAARLANSVAGNNSEQTLSGMYATLLPGAQEPLLRPIHALSEITMRLADRGNGVAARHGLQGLTAILAEYLKARRTSSLAFASSIHPLAVESDSQSILSQSLDRLNEMGGRFLRARQIDSSLALVDSYGTLSAAAIQIEFVGQSHENPIAYQVAFYLKGFVDAATRQGDKEVPFRAIETFAQLGEYAATHSNVTLITTAAQELASIGVYGATSQVWFITERSLQAESRLIRALFPSRGHVQHFADEILQHLFFTHQAAVRAQIVTSDRTLDSTTVLRKPFDDLQEIVNWVRREYDSGDATRRLDFSRTFKSFSQPLYVRLRSAYREIDLGSVYTDTAAELIFKIVRACVAMDRADSDERVAKSIKKFTRLLLWIGDRSDLSKSQPGLEHVIDEACKIAMMLIKEKQTDDHVFAALDTQFESVQRVLKKNSGSYGYYELRLMLRICYCGTVALRYQRQEIVDKTLSMVKEFEDEQKATSNDAKTLPSLLGEVLSWRETVMGIREPMVWEDANEVAARLVTPKEVDKFIASAWGST